MRSTLRVLTAVLAALTLSFVVAACGSDDSSGGGGSGSASSGSGSGASGSADLIKKDAANASKSVTVGSKNFAEQYILGNIYSQALTAAGFKVKEQLDLGSEQVAYKALKGNKISLYPEYTGTALTSFYRVKIDKIPRDPQQSFDQLKADASKDGITALPQTKFQDTFVVSSTKATAKKLGNPKTITDLAKQGSKVSISGFPECRQRTDCLLGLRDSYGWKPKFVSSQGKFSDLDQGQSDLTFGFSTDGELALGKYATYQDDKRLFPPYYVSALVNKQGVDALGQAGQDVIAKVQSKLDVKTMQELNSRVTLDKQDPAAVAKDYLTAGGFIAKQ